MGYFNSFESYTLLLLQNENIRHPKYPISTHPAEENNSCMQRMPMFFLKNVFEELHLKSCCFGRESGSSYA